MQMNKQTSYLPHSAEDVSFGASPATFTPPNHIHMVRLVSDQDCKIGWKSVTGTIKLVAGIPEYFSCDDGDQMTVTRVTVDGTLNVGYMTN